MYYTVGKARHKKCTLYAYEKFCLSRKDSTGQPKCLVLPVKFCFDIIIYMYMYLNYLLCPSDDGLSVKILSQLSWLTVDCFLIWFEAFYPFRSGIHLHCMLCYFGYCLISIFFFCWTFFLSLLGERENIVTKIYGFCCLYYGTAEYWTCRSHGYVVSFFYEFWAPHQRAKQF